MSLICTIIGVVMILLATFGVQFSGFSVFYLGVALCFGATLLGGVHWPPKGNP